MCKLFTQTSKRSMPKLTVTGVPKTKVEAQWHNFVLRASAILKSGRVHVPAEQPSAVECSSVVDPHWLVQVERRSPRLPTPALALGARQSSVTIATTYHHHHHHHHHHHLRHRRPRHHRTSAKGPCRIERVEQNKTHTQLGVKMDFVKEVKS